MKSYTDIEQSKKLAEILPLESADMSWVSNGLGKPFARTIPIKGDPEELCACWSLAALSEFILPYIEDDNGNNYKFYISKDGQYRWIAYYESDNASIHIKRWNGIEMITEPNPIDACYKIIVLSYEQKLI